MKTAVRQSLPLAVLVALSAFPGCEAAKKLLEGSDRPTARVKGVALRDLSLDGVALDFDLEVSNPYAVPLPIAALDYELAGESGTPFLSGRATDQGTVPAHGERVLPLAARVSFASLLKTLQGVRPGAVVPYTASVDVGVDAPAVGRLTIPISHRGEVPIPAVPDVALKEVKWGKLSLSEATATLRLEVGNTNAFPFDLDRLAYSLSLASEPVASASLAQAASLPAGGRRELQIPLSVSLSSLGLAAVNTFRGSGASYRLAGALEGRTPFGPLALPFDRSGDAPFTH